jgi:hypothetical protein
MSRQEHITLLQVVITTVILAVAAAFSNPNPAF